jgi:protein TonB
VSAALDDTGSGDNSSGNGEPGGQKYGVPGGDPYSTETGEDSGTETDGRSILTPGVGGVTIPELLERVDPAYPDTARKLRQEGTVLLEAVITASGAVDEIRVVASRGPLLDSAAIAAVRRWRYRPATLNGRAVAVFLTVRVTFGLSG